MTIAAYQYLSDDGNIYQVLLPSDFAAALNYQPATGAELYLPAYISPRYATYNAHIPGLYVSAVVTTPFNVGNPPGQISVSGFIYVLQSSYGEVRGLNTAPNVLTIAGPQGPQGATGATGPTGPQGPQGPQGDPAAATFSLSSAQLLSIFTTPVQILPGQGANTVIVPLYCTLRYKFGGAQYLTQTGLLIDIGGQSQMALAAAISTTADRYETYVAASQTFLASEINGAMTITAASNPTAGNGTVEGSIMYRIVSLP